MIPLSLVLVVVSATTLGFGVFDSSDKLIWASLVTGLGAVALVAGSVLRRRRQLVPVTVPDGPGPTTGPAVPVGSASAGPAPAPSPTPSRPDAPTTGPVLPPGSWPGAETWPWATTPPAGSADPGSRPGWTGPVPAVPPPLPVDPPPVDLPLPVDAPLPVDPSVPPGDVRPAGPVTPPPAEPVPAAPAEDREPGIERVAVRDALRVAQLDDEVVVVDGHPRYHLAGCPTLAGATTSPLAVAVARRAGFTPCAVCGPDATLLARRRDRTAERSSDER